MQETTDRLARRLRRQAAWCSELESPLYASLLESAADDLESGGPTGEVLDVKTRKKLTDLRDEKGRNVMSEKMLEIDFRNHEPVRNGDQFGVGRKVDSRQP